MRRCVCAALAAGVIGLATALAAGGGEFGVPLRAIEPAGIDRRAEPISGGVPLPKGRFKADQAFAVFADDGRELPCQALPLVVDTDGTVRWVLVDFADDVPAGATRKYVLRPAAAAARPARPLTVAQTAAGVTIDTGAVRLTISRTRPFSLFSDVRAGGRAVIAGGRVRYTDGFGDVAALRAGPSRLLDAVGADSDLREVRAKAEPVGEAASEKTYFADRPGSVAVEYAGPVRATVAARGRFVGDGQTKMQYVARITAWAGSSAVHVKYSLANSNPDHYCYRTVKDSTIELNLSAPAAGTILGAGKPLLAGPQAWIAQTLLPTAAGSATAGAAGRQLWTSTGRGDRAEGWIAARRGASLVQVCDLYFADDPARKLAVRDGKLLLSGVIERPAGQKGLRGRPYSDTTRCIADCSHLSSQYLIDFAAPAAAARLSAKARAAQHRLLLLAAPEQYLHETEAMPYGRFGTLADEMACFKVWGWKYDPSRSPKAPPRRRTYGRFFRTIDNHYEPEEDSLDQMLIMYLRTASRAYFDNALSWANYAMDLYAWRTDGWRFKDGGVWWHSGPKGHRPQRSADPVAHFRNRIPAGSSGRVRAPWTAEMVRDNYYLADSKSCYCHNWCQGLLAWYCLTGDRDALEAAIDRVEQDIDTLRRARRYEPGKADSFSRDFTRASYNAHAARWILPADEFIREASEFLAQVYLARPTKEPRGLVNAAKPWRRSGLRGDLERYVGRRGVEELRRLGYTFDARTSRMTDPKTGRSWYVLHNPHTWMFPPLSRAMELYWRITGNEDAFDWTIAYGQAAARVLYQDHGLLSYGRMLVDFPQRGVARDWASWAAPEGSQHAEGLVLSGFLARFHPDVCGRAYWLCGEGLLKQRAYGFWRAGSHRGYRSTRMMPLDRVGMWLDFHSTHDGQTDFVGRTIYIWAHPRTDDRPPRPVADLKVSVSAGKARVTFTAPADEGGGRVARYQVKCSDRPIVEYEKFLGLFNSFQDLKHCNWWMATNLAGEPVPGRPGRAESFTVTGVPAGARHFAIRSFDESNNRSRLAAGRAGAE